MKKILIIEDEPNIRELILYNLKTNGYDGIAAEDGIMGITMVHREKPDLILLDIMKEGISGLKMAEMMKKNPDTAKIPIIFISAKDTEDDTVNGLNIGADDYIAKPFSIREVLSRVAAVLRRTSSTADAKHNTLNYKSLVMDLDRKSVSVDGEGIDLTKTEFEILHLLFANSPHVYSREEILSKIWSDDVIVLGRTVDVNITRLRRKIGEYGKCVVTRHGYGYCFEEK